MLSNFRNLELITKNVDEFHKNTKHKNSNSHALHSGGNDRFCARLKRTFRPLAPASKVI
jgi:hypothetical protein